MVDMASFRHITKILKEKHGWDQIPLFKREKNAKKDDNNIVKFDYGKLYLSTKDRHSRS